MLLSWFIVLRFSHNIYTFYLHEKDYVLKAAISMWYFFISFIQSSVRVKNGYKQLCYFFPNEIKNSTHSHEEISRPKQSTKFNTH